MRAGNKPHAMAISEIEPEAPAGHESFQCGACAFEVAVAVTEAAVLQHVVGGMAAC
jgi:hypothetical protein